eukprot:538410_1
MSLVQFTLIITMVVMLHGNNNHHILVTAPSGAASYGHWNQLLHISKELLTRNKNNFITFFIDENCAHYLNTIRYDSRINLASYQIIHTPKEAPLDLIGTNHMNKVQHINIFKAWKHFMNASQLQKDHVKTFLQNTQNNNHTLDIINLNPQMNTVQPITFDRNVDICLLDGCSIYNNYLCHLFNIPIINTMTPMMAETYLSKYSDLLFIIMNNKLFNYIQNMTTISSLGPPFTKLKNNSLVGPKTKQFGFLLYTSPTKLENTHSELSKWINKINTPILYISMGSFFLLNDILLQNMHQILVIHSKENNYRILWALR